MAEITEEALEKNRMIAIKYEVLKAQSLCSTPEAYKESLMRMMYSFMYGYGPWTAAEEEVAADLENIKGFVHASTARICLRE
jgi:hypothetical protein